MHFISDEDAKKFDSIAERLRSLEGSDVKELARILVNVAREIDLDDTPKKPSSDFIYVADSDDEDEEIVKILTELD